VGIQRGLLDLGANINLLPFTKYERLKLGELKPTKIVIHLTGRWTRLSRGVVEDILIRVGEFIYFSGLCCA